MRQVVKTHHTIKIALTNKIIKIPFSIKTQPITSFVLPLKTLLEYPFSAAYPVAQELNPKIKVVMKIDKEVSFSINNTNVIAIKKDPSPKRYHVTASSHCFVFLHSLKNITTKHTIAVVTRSFPPSIITISTYLKKLLSRYTLCCLGQHFLISRHKKIFQPFHSCPNIIINDRYNYLFFVFYMVNIDNKLFIVQSCGSQTLIARINSPSLFL